jgi:hypothetical protein
MVWFGRCYVDGVLIAEGAFLNAKDESEVFYVFVKPMELKADVSLSSRS